MDAKKLAKILLFVLAVLTLGAVLLVKLLDLEPKQIIGRD